MGMGEPARTDPRAARDVAALRARLTEVARRLGLIIEALGVVGDEPIWLIRAGSSHARRRLLIAAGFHGEEPAGCWGLVGYLESIREWGEVGVDLSLLPLVNPTGIRAGRRENDWGENPNRGFCHTPSGEPAPSREGRILLDASPRLLPLARDGFLTLHEDVDLASFYIYTFETGTTPGPFTQALVAVESRFFAPVPDGPLEGAVVNGGVILNHCDGSFEDFVFHTGVPRTACTETPGALDFSTRVEANAAITDAFVRFHAELPTD
jgi:predicted deacylase